MNVRSLDDARRERGNDALDFFSASTKPKLINDVTYPWWDNLLDELNELLRLHAGWDGYQGRPVKLATATFALEILKVVCGRGTGRPDIMSGSGGDLLIEWEQGQKLIQVHVRGANNFLVYRTDDASGLEEERLLRNDVSILETWIDWLSGDGSDAATATAR